MSVHRRGSLLLDHLESYFQMIKQKRAAAVH